MPEQEKCQHHWRSVDTHKGANGATYVLQQCAFCPLHRDVSIYDLVDKDGNPKTDEQVQREEKAERRVEL